MEALADSFEVAGGGHDDVVINVAATSLLARQIERGARADLFVSAHPAWTNYLLEKEKLIDPDTLPISNRLVYVARIARGRDTTLRRIALADPEHVPAGMYAKAALQCSGEWDQLKSRIVPTVDVRAALAAVESGALDAAVVYHSDALHVPDLIVSPAVAGGCQPSILYTVGLVRGGSELSRARELLAYIVDPARGAVWSKFGFENRR
jgi:molybdate transport system substrate-binding protein